MFESYDTQKRRKAIALVLEDKLTPSQVAHALNYTGRAVRLWVRAYYTRSACHDSRRDMLDVLDRLCDLNSQVDLLELLPDRWQSKNAR